MSSLGVVPVWEMSVSGLFSESYILLLIRVSNGSFSFKIVRRLIRASRT